MSSDIYDVVVVGGGIAGTSIAYELATDERVMLLEKEQSLGTHATGRSAAMYLATYGGQQVRVMTGDSYDFLRTPPEYFQGPLMAPRPLLQVARSGKEFLIEELFKELGPDVSHAALVSEAEILTLCDIVRGGVFGLGLYESGAMELDVHALQSGYVRGLRARGGHIETNAEVVSMRSLKAGWEVHTSSGRRVKAGVVVNAAGAWADEIATLAGVPTLGLRAKRRSAFMLSTGGKQVHALPLLYDIEETFYCKPEGEDLLCSPADADAVQPGHASASQSAIARALDEIHTSTTLTSRRVKTSWAGLRTFAPDNEFVFGFDPCAPGLFWLAGQGGYGIQTAPSAAKLGASVVRNNGVPGDLSDVGIEWDQIDIARFR